MPLGGAPPQIYDQASDGVVKLRFASCLNGEAVQALGGSAIGRPAPQIPESLSQVADQRRGAAVELIPALKMHELVHDSGRLLEDAHALIAKHAGAS